MSLKENKIFRSIIIPLCIIICFMGIWMPSIGVLPQAAVHVLCVFLGSLILWLTIGIDWPSLLCLFSLAFIQINVNAGKPDLDPSYQMIGFGEVLKNGFGDTTFLFLLFTFVCTYALSKTSIIKRITLAFINSKLAKKNGLWFSFLFLIAILLVGLVTSPTVLFVVVLPMLNSILEVSKIDKGEKIGKALMMGLGFTVSISSGMTPIAHVFPVLAMQQLGSEMSVSTASYMAFAMPIGLITFLLMFLILFVIYKPDFSKLSKVDTSSLEKDITKINKADIIVIVTFITVILLWIGLDIVKTIDPKSASDFAKFTSKLTIAMPPLLGMIVLCVVRVDNKPIIKVDEAFKNVPWSSLIMCAATLALGYMLKHDGVGLSSFLKDNLGQSIKHLSPILLLIIFGVWATLQTNVSSNMVTATLVASVAFMVLKDYVDLETKVVICIIGYLASLAFATPPSMPHIAIIGSSEYCSTKDVLMFGSLIMTVSLIIALGIGYPLGTLVM